MELILRIRLLFSWSFVGCKYCSFKIMKYQKIYASCRFKNFNFSGFCTVTLTKRILLQIIAKCFPNKQVRWNVPRLTAIKFCVCWVGEGFFIWPRTGKPVVHNFMNWRQLHYTLYRCTKIHQSNLFRACFWILCTTNLWSYSCCLLCTYTCHIRLCFCRILSLV